MFGDISALAKLADTLESNLKTQVELLTRIADQQQALNDKFLPVLTMFENDMKQAIAEDTRIRQLQTADNGANAERCA
jgi:hypothetical protein